VTRDAGCHVVGEYQDRSPTSTACATGNGTRHVGPATVTARRNCTCDSFFVLLYRLHAGQKSSRRARSALPERVNRSITEQPR
jgi:hypothetical protein